MGMYRMFSQWYFIVVCVLLGLSLAAATINRFFALRKQMSDNFIVPEEGYRHDELNEEKISILRTYLQKKRYRELNTGEATIYYKNRLGYYGSALVYLSLLLILIFGGSVLALSDVEDVILLPGETAILADGSTLQLFSFTRVGETGRAESISVIEVITPDGRSSGIREIRVNTPLRFNSFTYYQFNHMYAASITATDTETGGWDRFYLVERSFLSADERTGIWFETVFQSWRMDEETGRIVPLRFDIPIFPDPLYYIMVIDEHVQEYRFAIPGSYVDVGTIRFEFNDLINYPGIRVSFSPHPLPAFLIASSILLVVGLFLTFYLTPAIVVLRGNNYKITTLPSSGIELEIIATLYEGEDIPKNLPSIVSDENLENDPKNENSDREVDI